MTNKEKIENFMKQIDASWNDLKKLRYICIKLCEIYEYDPKYAYATEDGKLEYMKKLYENKTQEGLKAEDYEQVHKICVDLFQIYERLIREAGIPEEKYVSLGNAIFYDNGNGMKYKIRPVDELFCVKTKSKPKGFSIENGMFGDMDSDTAVMEIDKELGFIDERGYIGDTENIVGKQNITDTESIIASVKDVLGKGAKYLQSVIGNEINNVELHKFYGQLLKTGFPSISTIVKPLSTPKLEEIQYVVLVKTNKEANECIAFLYDKMKKMFEYKTIEDIKAMMQELGLSVVGKDNVGCIDGLCDIER